MNARLEKKLRLFAIIVTASMIGAAVNSLTQGHTTPREIAVGISYGLLISAPLVGISLFLLEGPMRVWLGGLSFTANLMVRSAIYAAIIVPILFFQLGGVIAGVASDPLHKTLWIDITYSVAFVFLVNLVLGITNIIGPRAFLNFIIGRYHTPIEEKRFVLFVDIAGSTGMAERLGGIAIHRLLDRTFRLLTLSVIDYRGEVLVPLDEAALRQSVRRLAADGVEAIAVCFLFSFLNPDHERRAARIIELSFVPIAMLSS